MSLPSLRGPRGLLGSAEPPAALATRVHRSWTRFAETGSPGWPAQPSAGGYVQHLGHLMGLIHRYQRPGRRAAHPGSTPERVAALPADGFPNCLPLDLTARIRSRG
ncbi:hypothetical protein [Streptomyces sp. NPDC056682]|uniref:hypothetical protein n=1 Tax=Streptomyces sp. NPDC056682 TaxID=3345909 RepID=UPI0036C4389D